MYHLRFTSYKAMYMPYTLFFFYTPRTTHTIHNLLYSNVIWYVLILPILFKVNLPQYISNLHKLMQFDVKAYIWVWLC